jgi:hypothetical protein
MISSVLALALAAAAPGPSPDAIARARKAYSACLGGFLKKGLKDGMEEAAFEAAIGPACTAQEQAFRTAVIAADTAAGVKRATAEENAGSEVDDMLLNTKEGFKSYKTTNTSPGS